MLTNLNPTSKLLVYEFNNKKIFCSYIVHVTCNVLWYNVFVNFYITMDKSLKITPKSVCDIARTFGPCEF